MSGYTYEFTVRGVKFVAEYIPGAGWVVRHGGRYLLAGRKASALLKKQVVQFVADVIAKEKCGGERSVSARLRRVSPRQRWRC
mgnify:CR=1 FL=1